MSYFVYRGKRGRIFLFAPSKAASKGRVMRTGSPNKENCWILWFLRREMSSHTGWARQRITSQRGWRRDGPAHETRVTLDCCLREWTAPRRAEEAAGREGRDHAESVVGTVAALYDDELGRAEGSEGLRGGERTVAIM